MSPARPRTTAARLALVWLLAVLTGALVLAASQAERRADLEERFIARSEVGTAHLSAYLQDVLVRQQRAAARGLAGARVGRAAFERTVGLAGHDAAVLLDDRGRVLHALPRRLGLTGTRLTGRYAHLASAVAGRPTVSSVVRSAVDGRSIVAFAVPFDTPGGRRVLSSGHVLDRTPLGSFVRTALTQAGARAFILDDAGLVVAGRPPAPAAGRHLPLFAAASGHFPAADGTRFYARSPVPGTSWQLVLTVPDAVLLETAGGPGHWLPWLALLVIAVSGLGLVRLGARLSATRRALAESEALHRRIVASLPEAAVLAFDRDLRFTTAEGPALAGIGWSAEAMLGRRLTDLVPAERAAPLVGAYEAALAGRTTRLDHVTAGGRVFAVEVGPLRDETGTIAGGLVVSHDVTERREAERERSEAEERFERAFDAAPIGMAMVALDGAFLRVNDALGETLGHEGIGLLGRPLAAVTHPADVPALEAALAGDADVRRLEQRCVRADGEERAVELAVTLVRDGDGRPLYFVVQLVDVTERRAAEVRLRRLADHDALTGLLNGRSFRERLAAHAARTTGGETTLLLLDLDRFKLVNDRFGHAAGDALLAGVAGAIRQRLRGTDLVGRLGGDEFAVLLPDTPVAAAELVAAHLRAAIAEHGLVGEGERAVQVRASIGTVAVPPGVAPDVALARADAAMYAEKRRAPARPAGRA